MSRRSRRGWSPRRRPRRRPPRAAAHRPGARRRRRQGRRAHRCHQGARGDAHPHRLHRRHLDGLDRRGRLRHRPVARRSWRRSSPRSTGARCSPTCRARTCPTIARTSTRFVHQRPGAGHQGRRHRRPRRPAADAPDRGACSARSSPTPAASRTSTSCRSPSVRCPPILRAARCRCGTGATWRRRCAPAWPCPGCSPRWRPTTTSTSTACWCATSRWMSPARPARTW